MKEQPTALAIQTIPDLLCPMGVVWKKLKVHACQLIISLA